MMRLSTSLFLVLVLQSFTPAQAGQDDQTALCLRTTDQNRLEQTASLRSLNLNGCVAQQGVYLPSLPNLSEWRDQALRGDARAQYWIADALDNNAQYTEFRAAAASWYQLAADGGDHAAMLALANLYETGDIVAKDIDRAYDLYRQALDVDTLELPNRSNDESIDQQRDALELAKRQLAREQAIKRALEQELRNARAGGEIGDSLGFALSAAKQSLQREKSQTHDELLSLEQARTELKAVQENLNDSQGSELSAEQLKWLTQRVDTEFDELTDRQTVLLAEQRKLQKLGGGLNDTTDDPRSIDVLAMESKEARNKALKQYLSELDDSIQHRSSSNDKRQKKLEFLQKRIAHLKKDTQREVSADDRVLLQRALSEMDHRYQGKIDYLATNLEGEMGRVNTLSSELAMVEKQAQEREKVVQVITDRLDQASKLVDRQSSLVNKQSDDLRLAIDSMNKAHQGQPAKDAQALWSDSDTPASAPEIVISWPQVVQKGDQMVVNPVAGTVLNVVGGVQSNSVIKKFTFDGKAVTLDKNGLFAASVDVATESRSIDLIAYNESGQVATSTTLQIIPAVEPPQNRVRMDQAFAKIKKLNDIKFGNYHALIIGNNNYEGTGFEVLDTAENDARSMAQLLEKSYGFEVELVLNATRDDTLRALEAMRAKLTEDDNLLIFYAGHGIMDPESDQGYWVPVDGTSDTSARWISNATITDQIRAMTARNVMVVADSCYSGSLMRSGVMYMRSGLTPEKKIKRISEDLAVATRIALSSGGLQPVIDSIDNSPNSVFTGAMLQILRNNVALLDADSLATDVSHSVAMATKDTVRQVPRFAPLIRAGHEGGEFYFVPLSWRSPS